MTFFTFRLLLSGKEVHFFLGSESLVVVGGCPLTPSFDSRLVVSSPGAACWACSPFSKKKSGSSEPGAMAQRSPALLFRRNSGDVFLWSPCRAVPTQEKVFTVACVLLVYGGA